MCMKDNRCLFTVWIKNIGFYLNSRVTEILKKEKSTLDKRS